MEIIPLTHLKRLVVSECDETSKLSENTSKNQEGEMYQYFSQ